MIDCWAVSQADVFGFEVAVCKSEMLWSRNGDFGGCSYPPGSERIACGAFYEVAILMPTKNESNFNKPLVDRARRRDVPADVPDEAGELARDRRTSLVLM